MAQRPKTILVVGTGLIGSSWTVLFLAHGHSVLALDPGAGAEQKLRDFLAETWPLVPDKAEGASLEHCTFLGQGVDDVRDDVWASVGWVQEVWTLANGVQGLSSSSHEPYVLLKLSHSPARVHSPFDALV